MSTAEAPPGAGPPPRVAPEQIRAIPIRHWGRWVTAAAILLIGAWFVSALIGSHAVDWAIVRKFLFNKTILQGVRNTIVISVIAQAAGIVIGVLCAVARLSRNPVLTVTSSFYTWFFRGTPVLVQLIFWFSAVPLVFKHLTIAVPFTHITLYTTPMVKFMTPFMAAFLGLALNEGAYMAEIVRAGILSVSRGQTDAALALGMTPTLTMRRIVLPQAMRVIVPPTGNEFISMLKTSSLASVVLYEEVLRRATAIYSTNLHVLELLIVASIWYLVITSFASVGQIFLDRRYGRAYIR